MLQLYASANQCSFHVLISYKVEMLQSAFLGPITDHQNHDLPIADHCRVSVCIYVWFLTVSLFHVNSI